MTPEIRYNFDRAKPFYPIIVSYSACLLGAKEVALLGVKDIKRTFEYATNNKDDIKRLNNIAGPLSLKISGDSNRLEIDLLPIANEVASNPIYLLKTQIQSAWYCLALAHEITKNKPYRDKSELWEFLRHCRNAVAHNGQWNIMGNEPKHLAQWRNITLDTSFHDQNLIKDENGIGTLEMGDPIALLHDIEVKFPDMC